MEWAYNQGIGIPQIELPDLVGSESSLSERLGLRFYSTTENSLRREETLRCSGIPHRSTVLWKRQNRRNALHHTIRGPYA